MFIELEEKLIEEVEKATGGRYDKKGNMLNAEYVNEVLVDLLHEIDRLKEQLEDEQEDKELYYTRKTQDGIARGL